MATETVLEMMNEGFIPNGFGRAYEPDEVISDRLFFCDDELREYTVPKGVLHIGADAFAGCSNLRKINIPESVKSIDYEAFAGCTSLEEISLPDTIWYLAYGICHGCTSLKSVKYAHCGHIPLAAFAGCTSLEEIDIPNEVKYIGVQAFIHTALISVVIPENATICCDAFSENNKLRSVVFGDNAIIEHHAFYNCRNLNIYNLKNAEFVDPHSFDVG